MYRLFGKDYRVETFSVYDRPKAKKELSVTDPNNRKDLLLKKHNLRRGSYYTSRLI